MKQTLILLCLFLCAAFAVDISNLRGTSEDKNQIDVEQVNEIIDEEYHHSHTRLLEHDEKIAEFFDYFLCDVSIYMELEETEGCKYEESVNVMEDDTTTTNSTDDATDDGETDAFDWSDAGPTAVLLRFLGLTIVLPIYLLYKAILCAAPTLAFVWENLTWVQVLFSEMTFRFAPGGK